MLTLDKMAEVMKDGSGLDSGYQARLAMSTSARELPSWITNGEYKSGADNLYGIDPFSREPSTASRGLALSASAAAFPGAKASPYRKKMLPSVRVLRANIYNVQYFTLMSQRM